MRTISLAEAESHQSEIIEQAGAGEGIVIEKAGKPIARLVPPIEHDPPRRVLGLGRGQLKSRMISTPWKRKRFGRCSKEQMRNEPIRRIQIPKLNVRGGNI